LLAEKEKCENIAALSPSMRREELKRKSVK
jgi:hypothetical protein